MAGDADIAWFCELLASLGVVRGRRMFGGWGLYAEGRMVALVAGGELFLKTAEADRPAFAAAGSAPFIYRSASREVAMSYWKAPDEALDDPEAMRPWARRALAAAEAKALAPKRPRRRRQS